MAENNESGASVTVLRPRFVKTPKQYSKCYQLQFNIILDFIHELYNMCERLERRIGPHIVYLGFRFK